MSLLCAVPLVFAVFSVDPELLRISTVISSLKKNGIEVVRFNLSNAPQEFVKNQMVNKMMSAE
jgi:hypothetical protein